MLNETKQIKSRLQVLHPTGEVCDRLAAQQIGSAQQIAAMEQDYFAEKYHQTLGLTKAETVQIHQKAVRVKNKVIHYLMNLRTTVASPYYRAMKGKSLGNDLIEYFEGFPSYQELFGQLADEQFADGMTIFSPAAYFVDLLRITTEYVTKPNEQREGKSALALFTRRPDLAHIPLTKESEEKPVPYLSIVNERLADCIRSMGGNTAEFDEEFLQQELYLCLDEIGADGGKLCDAFAGEAMVKTLYTLRISPKQWQIITVAETAEEKLARYYGLANHETLAKLQSAELFRARVKLSEEAFQELIYQGLSERERKAGLVANLFINQGFLAQQYLYLKEGKIINFCPQAADRLNRFLRFCRCTGLSFTQGERLIRCLSQGNSVAVDEALLCSCSEALSFLRANDYKVQELCCLLGLIQTYGENLPGGTPFDRLFNQGKTLPYHPAQNPENVTYQDACIEWNPQGLKEEDAAVTSWLSASLHVSAESLCVLALRLFAPTTGPADGPIERTEQTDPIHPTDQTAVTVATTTTTTTAATVTTTAASTTTTAATVTTTATSTTTTGTAAAEPLRIKLDVVNLSALYRHTLLAAKLELSLTDYILLLEICGKVQNNFNLADLKCILSVKKEIDENMATMAQWNFAVSPDCSMLAKPSLTEAAVMAWVLDFSKTADPTTRRPEQVMAQLCGFFQAEADLVEAVLSLFYSQESLPEGLKHWSDLFFLAWPKVSAEHRNFFLKLMNFLFHFSCVAQWFGFSASLVKSYGEVTLAYEGAGKGEHLNVQKMENKEQRLKAGEQMAGKEGLVAERQGFVTDGQTIAVEQLVALCHMKKYILEDQSGKENVLRYLKEQSTGEPAAERHLSEAFGWDGAMLRELLAADFLEKKCLVKQLDQLFSCFAFIKTLGSTVKLPIDLVRKATVKPDERKRLIDQLWNGIRSGCEPSSWPQRELAIRKKLEQTKREYLLPETIRLLQQKFQQIRTAEDVYQYLLIDVQMEATAQISYLREAISAVQLYLQRCRFHLERDVKVIKIPEAWWSWLLDYASWEANRQIFVYPENYLLPGVRKDKTSLFQEMERSLLQSDLTAPYVEQLYTKYLDGFYSLSQITIVDCYRCEQGDGAGEAVLYLFGRTKKQPYTFYWCQQKEGYGWSEWQKIDLTIQGELITPVFVFHRLYLFWVEKKAVASPSIRVPKTIQTQGDPMGAAPHVSSDHDTASGGKATSEHEAAEDEILSKTNQTVKISVSYSFLDLQGKWVTPQTLAEDQIVFFDDFATKSTLKNEHPVKNQWDQEALPWKKLYLFPVKGQNLADGMARGEQFERLILYYGMPFQNTGRTVSLNWLAEDGSDRVKFEQLLYEKLKNYNNMVTGGRLGFSFLGDCMVLNENMERDYLLSRNETLITDGYWQTEKLIPFRPCLNNTLDKAGLIYSKNIILDNYMTQMWRSTVAEFADRPLDSLDFTSDSISAATSAKIFQGLSKAKIIDEDGTISPEDVVETNLSVVVSEIIQNGATEFRPGQLTEIENVWFEKMGGQTIFSNIEGKQTVMKPVLNQPGWFLMQCDDETFLLRAKPMDLGKRKQVEPFTMIAKGLKISRPPVNQHSFSSLTANPSDVETALLNAQIVDEQGFIIDTNLTREQVNKALIGQEKKLSEAVYRILKGYPVISENVLEAFFSDLTLSKELYTILKEKNIVDPSSRMDSEQLLAVPFGELFQKPIAAGKVHMNQISGIYDVLLHAPQEVSVAYFNEVKEDTVIELSEYEFSVVRLSTGAADRLRRTLFLRGADQLLSLSTQQIPICPIKPFARLQPNPDLICSPQATDGAQVDFEGLYGAYYWEIFYHLPMAAAQAHASHGNYAEAKRWLEYVFDPKAKEARITAETFAEETRQIIAPAMSEAILDYLKSYLVAEKPVVDEKGRVSVHFSAETELSDWPSGVTAEQMQMVKNILLNYQISSDTGFYWQFRPFRKCGLEELDKMLADTNPAMKVYNDDPFDPHAIARIRIGAYEKYTVIEYVENLLAWADRLFAQDGWECVSQATMLYVLAAGLLGERPEKKTITTVREPATFATIQAKYEEDPSGIPQFLIELENYIAAQEESQSTITRQKESQSTMAQQGENPSSAIRQGKKPWQAWPDAAGTNFSLHDLYFHIPENHKLLTLWDQIEDRLGKIRASMSISGEARQLSLFQTIDPALLTSVGAPGGSSAASLGAMRSHYRFHYLLERAKTLASQLTRYGTEILATLEKQDAEELNLLHQRQEQETLLLLKEVKQSQIKEAKANVVALNRSLDAAQERQAYYNRLLTDGLSAEEQESLQASDRANSCGIAANVMQMAASLAYAVPQFGSPFAMTYGGVQLGSVLSSVACGTELGVTIHNHTAQRTATMAEYKRRSAEWSMQKQQAAAEERMISAQIESLQEHVKGLQADLHVHEQSILFSRKLYDTLQSKFTNQELYQWMAGRISALYWQLFQITFDVAAMAQLAYQFEIDRDDQFLTGDVWVSGRKGILSGEGLEMALARMEYSYYKQHQRRLEIEKIVSFAGELPDALAQLKEQGSCEFELTEMMYDRDYKGHYLRKLKSIALSVPVVMGPYDTIKATLVQTNNAVLLEPVPELLKELQRGIYPDDHRVRVDWMQNQKIAISKGIDDTGLFVLNFEDQMYLPFEGTGAISKWRLEMPKETNRFSFDKLSDVILHIRYTALEDEHLKTI